MAFLQAYFNQSHQLVIVTKIRMTQQVLMALDQFLQHVDTATHIVESVDLFRQLQIVVNQFQVRLLQLLQLLLQFLNFVFVIFLCHKY